MTIERKSNNYIGFAVCISIGLIISAYILGQSASKIILKDQSILVKGYSETPIKADSAEWAASFAVQSANISDCLLYTSPSPRDQRGSRMPSSA